MTRVARGGVVFFFKRERDKKSVAASECAEREETSRLRITVVLLRVIVTLDVVVSALSFSCDR